ncbi:MAG: PQ-loop repeat-containing protein [Bacteroidaceae bacterium]|nr:PQ-loop repeat-containing protein [Bacteroidales bacterium]MBO5263743.1 PQ-loop repeat-containing protein [Bacteroidaceae bacterium]MBQ8256503.1 PQ-loop repeat-containing protein [Bacteroidaceae bacterium]
MEQVALYDVCAYAGSIAIILGYLPQAIQTIRTRNTDGISMTAFLMMAIGAFGFMLQGFLHKPDIIWSIAITNLITTICSAIVFVIKVYNDYFKKK